MADHSKPTVLSTESGFVNELDARFDDLAKMLDATATTPTNLPIDAVRRNGLDIQRWTGSAWVTVAKLNSTDTAAALTALGVSAFMRQLLDDANAATALTTLGVSAFAQTLLDDSNASAALTTLGVSAFAKTLLDDADAASARATLGAASTLSVPTAASSAENVAGMVEGKYVDPLGIRESLNAAGSAPVYAPRAWVNFNGTGAVSIRAGGNVSSITDNGVGDYTINFLEPMPDTNYCLLGTGAGVNGTDFQTWIAYITAPGTSTPILKSTTQCRVCNFSGYAVAPGTKDSSEINIVILR